MLSPHGDVHADGEESLWARLKARVMHLGGWEITFFMMARLVGSLSLFTLSCFSIEQAVHGTSDPFTFLNRLCRTPSFWMAMTYVSAH